MPNFTSFDDLFEFVQQNPDTVPDFGILVDAYCPTCNTVEKIEILSDDKGKCTNCHIETCIKMVVEIV